MVIVAWVLVGQRRVVRRLVPSTHPVATTCPAAAVTAHDGRCMFPNPTRTWKIVTATTTAAVTPSRRVTPTMVTATAKQGSEPG